MLFIVTAMLLILVVAGLVLAYVAYPHRGQDVPNLPWLTDAMNVVVERAPVIQPEERGAHLDLLRRK